MGSALGPRDRQQEPAAPLGLHRGSPGGRQEGLHKQHDQELASPPHAAHPTEVTLQKQ